MISKRRLAALLMAATMTIATFPVNALADSGSDVPIGGLCKHHPEHTADCGYIEGTEGTPCNHEHTDECYTEVTNCIHEHTEDCYPAESVSDDKATPSDADKAKPTECTHECSAESGCIKEELNCQHEHDETCGYAPAAKGIPCTYVCEICNPQSNGQPEDKPLPDGGKCVCTKPCTRENINGNCPVCSAAGVDLSACKGGQIEQAQTVTITGFDNLPDDVREQHVPAGTKLEELSLPATLGASGYVEAQDSGEPESLTIEKVEWESDPAYDENAGQGEYIFTAKLPEGYVLAEGVSLPQITVMVEPVNLLLAGGQALTHDVSSNAVVIDDTCGSPCPGHIISGKSETNTIKVTTGSHRITLDNVEIDVNNSPDAIAFEISRNRRDNFEVELILEGDNTLKSGSGKPGLSAGEGSALIISEGTAGGSLTASGGEGRAGILLEKSLVVQSGTINAYGGKRGAGIGGNSVNIEIQSGTVHAEGGAGTGGYSSGGAGIGGSGNTILISGGVVDAIGGDPLTPNTSPPNGGRGIGGDRCEITISGGVVTATGKDVDGIIGTSFSTGEDGSAIIFSSSAITAGHPEEWSGVIFQDSSGQVYVSGDDKTFTLPAALEIPAGKILTIPEGVTLVNDYGITGSGTIIKNGILAGTGEVGEQITIASLPENCEISKQGTAVTTATGMISQSGNYYLLSDTRRSDPLIIRGNSAENTVVNLCLNGYSLSCDGGSVVIVQNATLNLYDCQGTGKITGGSTTGASCSTGNGQYVSMYGGGLTAKGAVVNLHGGAITQNTCTTQDGYGGGGIYLANSTLTLYEGASVSDNTGPTGGIYADYNDTIIMTGGAITGNISNLSYAPTGGGISLQSGSSTPTRFEMSGGEISGNTAKNGGGIFVADNRVSLTITGGSITGNKATSSGQESGGGIFFRGSTEPTPQVHFAGSPYIYGNTNQAGDQSNITHQSPLRLYTLTGPLDDGAKIGFALSSGVGSKLVNDWNQYMGGKTISDYFVCDREDMGLKLGEDGDIILVGMLKLNRAPTEHGSFVLKVDGKETERACAGDTVTIVPLPEEGYTMDSVSVEYSQATGSVPVTDNQFTMPGTSGGVTITVTFKLKSYEVTFDSQGGSTVEAQTVAHGETISQPTNPTRTGYIFGGWYQEADCINSFDFNTPIIKVQTLYAKWMRNSSSGSGGSSHNSYRDNEYDFWMEVKDKIQDAQPGDTVKANAKSYDRMPTSVMDTLREAEGVTLHITWNGGDEIVIPSAAALNESLRIYYPLSYLEGIDFEIKAEPYNPSKMNPETGGVWEVTAPTADTTITTQTGEPEVTAPQRGLAETPEQAEKGVEKSIPGVYEPETEDSISTPAQGQNHIGMWIAAGAILLAAAGVGGFWYWRRKHVV